MHLIELHKLETTGGAGLERYRALLAQGDASAHDSFPRPRALPRAQTPRLDLQSLRNVANVVDRNVPCDRLTPLRRRAPGAGGRNLSGCDFLGRGARLDYWRLRGSTSPFRGRQRRRRRTTVYRLRLNTDRASRLSACPLVEVKRTPMLRRGNGRF
jgi:hypothetical protein